MKRLARLTLTVVLAAASVPCWAGEVKLSFSNGLVTIIATDATPRQILAEWARQGQVRVTNLDRLAGGPVTIQMTAVPEARALETLLRGTAGYVAAPRVEAVVAASGYDRIMLMLGVAPDVPAAGSSSGSARTSGGGRGRSSNAPAYDETTDEEMERVRQLMGSGRDAASPDAYRQSGPGQVVMPGIMAPSYGQNPGAPANMTQPGPAAGAARQPAAAGAATPGVFTAPPQPPPQPIKTTPDSNDRPLQTEAPVSFSSPLPGQIVGQPPRTVGAPAATTFQNPYGLPEPVRPPVVNPERQPVRSDDAGEGHPDASDSARTDQEVGHGRRAGLGVTAPHRSGEYASARRLPRDSRPGLGLLPHLPREGRAGPRLPRRFAARHAGARRGLRRGRVRQRVRVSGWRSRAWTSTTRPSASGRARLEALPFDAGSFDRVLCLDVLEHLSYAAQPVALAEIHRVLAADGEALRLGAEPRAPPVARALPPDRTSSSGRRAS